MLERKIFPDRLIETTATEKSLFPRLNQSDLELKKERPCRNEGRILRRPLSPCHITFYDVGLLRMTIFKTLTIP